MTAAELLVLPDDGMRHELVRGELITMPPAGVEHGVVSLATGAQLRAHARATGCGMGLAEVGFLIARDPDTVRAPDAAFIARERWEALGPTPKYWPEAPALAVEVVSPGDRFGEVQAKAFEWLDAGATAVLVLDPRRRTATVYRARDDVRVHAVGEELELDDAVPGWRPPVDDLFA
jgi:Uma2 family endonuclease